MNEAATLDLEAETTAMPETKPKQIVTHDHAVSSAGDMHVITPMAMLDRAISAGHNPETLQRLMDLQERFEKNQGRRAFDEAVAAAKAEISEQSILKNKTGHNSKRYADFAAYAKVIDPIIGKHGLSYRFRTHQETSIQVTCVLSHKDGHSEENTLAGPADTTGNKNAIQAIGSTLTYLQRYTLIQAFGLAASDDDDGKAATAGGMVSDEQVEKMRQLIMDVDADLPRLLKYLGVERLEDIYASKFDSVMAVIEQKRGAKK